MGAVIEETFLFCIEDTSVQGEYCLVRNSEFVCGIDEDDMKELIALFEKFLDYNTLE